MTRSEWDALTEWGARDAVVAENVMGLEYREWKPFYSPRGWYPVGHTGPCTGEDGGTPRGYCADLPTYTHDWEAMREVVEQMESEDFWVRMVRLTVRNQDGTEGPLEWLVDFRCVRAGTRGDHQATAPTLPEAVCIAALTALGHMERA